MIETAREVHGIAWRLGNSTTFKEEIFTIFTEVNQSAKYYSVSLCGVATDTTMAVSTVFSSRSSHSVWAFSLTMGRTCDLLLISRQGDRMSLVWLGYIGLWDCGLQGDSPSCCL